MEPYIYLIVVMCKIISWIGSFEGVQDDGVGVEGGSDMVSLFTVTFGKFKTQFLIG